METREVTVEEVTGKIEKLSVQPLRDPHRMMKVVEWMGKEHVSVHEKARPIVTNKTDVIIRVTSTAICGSDLHLYENAFPGMKRGDVLGHEFMGVVVETGPDVTKVKVGDKVVACFDIACGHCFYCEREMFTLCDTTNPDTPESKQQEEMYGHKMCGIYGYSHMVGGFEGGQAEYARVLYGDLNLLKVPDNMDDEKVLFLSDILCTAWHANELASVSENDTVAIWGSGPVGILAAHCAFSRGAKQVILVDCEQYRLDHAVKQMADKKLSTINFKDRNVQKTIFEMVGRNGVDCGIDACGFRYNKSWVHTIEKSLKMETDNCEVLNEIVTCVQKGGRIGIVGDYVGFCNHFNIGAFMEKGMSMAGGQTPVQKYWLKLLEKIESGELTPNMVVTHRFPLEKAPEAYKIFNSKEDGCVKVVLKPRLASAA